MATTPEEAAALVARRFETALEQRLATMLAPEGEIFLLIEQRITVALEKLADELWTDEAGEPGA